MLYFIVFALGAVTSSSHPMMKWVDLIIRPKPKPDATEVYGPDQMQKVDVWLPAGKGPFPTVIMIHGGCWQTHIADRSLMNWVADDLRRSGYAVWNIDYRGTDRPGGGYPGTFKDVADATDLIRTDAAKYNLDIGKLVAIGHSAGGHLALWLAGRPRLSPSSALYNQNPVAISSVISLGGLPDLDAVAKSPDNGCGTDVVSALTGEPTAERPDVLADTSVVRLLPLGVPQDLINGRRDRVIPYRLATGYLAKAEAAGDKVVLHTIPHTGHVELISPETPAWAEAKRLINSALATRESSDVSAAQSGR